MARTDTVPIKYRDFYDVPRMFVVQRGTTLLLFDCPFNEGIDGFGEAYNVYQLPMTCRAVVDGAGDWRSLPLSGRLVGSVMVADMCFDPSKRQWIDGAILERFR